MLHRRRRRLQLLVERGVSRVAFGRPLDLARQEHQVRVTRPIDIEAMRLIVQQAAKAMDVLSMGVGSEGNGA